MFFTRPRHAAASALASITVSVLLLACSTRANAWGKEGHEIVVGLPGDI